MCYAAAGVQRLMSMLKCFTMTAVQLFLLHQRGTVCTSAWTSVTESAQLSGQATQILLGCLLSSLLHWQTASLVR